MNDVAIININMGNLFSIKSCGLCGIKVNNR